MNHLEREVRALSWKQPFAELMLHNKIETRTWKTNYRGLVLICASKQEYATPLLNRISGGHQILRMGWNLKNPNPNYEGKAIALGELIDCRPMTPEDEDGTFVLFKPDLYCHFYKNVVPIEPFDWKGTQGWKILSQEEKTKIKFI